MIARDPARLGTEGLGIIGPCSVIQDHQSHILETIFGFVGIAQQPQYIRHQAMLMGQELALDRRERGGHALRFPTPMQIHSLFLRGGRGGFTCAPQAFLGDKAEVALEDPNIA